ncbi:aquaporin Z [Corallococcus sp. AB004]|uniref:aquaporin Z n=1 Tax=Corallococcus exiguus TaxID=83462 RepID=UPI000EA10E5C|nr:aquaporin Z [Corallococcus exiguus]NPD28898.1 aquaporin Z [Corallococcus exiguus]NRD48660.1 aquaporin Z [Corallococcus exiguus]RKI35908.1 aquaporin Z [Corallococcus sp. AB004]
MRDGNERAARTAPANGDAMQKYLAEAVGTFVLVLGGVGAAVLAGDRIGFLGVAFAFGLSLLAMVYTIGPISGCHVNPAVTVGLMMAGKFDKRHLAGYVIAQCVGAIIAAGVVLLIAKGAPGGYSAGAEGLGSNGYGVASPEGYGGGAAFIAEVVLTFLLVLTVLGATDSRAPVGFAGVAIGLVLTLIHLVGIPITNTSVNPARSLGPALFAGGDALRQLWMFIIAPLLGAAFASAVYRLVNRPAVQITAARAEQATDEERRERVAGPRDVERPV